MDTLHANGAPRVLGGTVHKTIALLQGALQTLGLDPDLGAVERIGVMVNRAMSAQQRSFHTPEHIFDLATIDDAHVTLAAIFHDLVYFQVDQGFSRSISELLDPYILVTEQGHVLVREDISPDDRSFWGCAAVFGVKPGQKLSPFGGLNEFLSALVMDLLLEGTVADVDLLYATACIEATIPFRVAEPPDYTPSMKLADRLKAVNEQFALGLDEAQLTRVVESAVRFANADVHNFAEEDVGRFLDNTWKLLPESNPELRFAGLYTMQTYGNALQKMHGFLSTLNAERVFAHYASEPSQEEYKRLTDLASRNLTTAARYLGVKLVTAGLLSALARLTGGDAPVAYFMGEISPDSENGKLSSHLPKKAVGYAREHSADDPLISLLEFGRASASSFDMQNSPLSLYVYQCIDDTTLTAAIPAARSVITDDLDPREFLELLPPRLVAAVSHAASIIAFTRSDALQAIAGEFGGVRA